MIRGYRFQKVSLRVSEKGQRIYFNTESDKDYTLLKGIALSVGNEEALHGSTFGFRVDEKEILDESHEAHLLVFGKDIAPNQKMLFFETPVPISASKLEGIYTDRSLQSLLGNASYSPSGGVISRSAVNIKKTYVSGKSIVTFGTVSTDSFQMQSGSGFGTVIALTPPSVTVYYPYDVKVTLLLTR